MATRVFTDEELVKLRSFPEITPNELIRFFTLTPADVEFVDPGRGRGPSDRIGLAVQLCTLPWLGFVPDDVTTAPPPAVAKLSEQLRIPVGELRHYAAKREQTRTDHLLQVARYLRWRPAKALEIKELDEFLLARAMEHDSPSLLFTLACEHLKSSRVIRLGVVKLVERVAAARAEAGRETYSRVVHLLTPSPKLWRTSRRRTARTSTSSASSTSTWKASWPSWMAPATGRYVTCGPRSRKQTDTAACRQGTPHARLENVITDNLPVGARLDRIRALLSGLSGPLGNGEMHAWANLGDVDAMPRDVFGLIDGLGVLQRWYPDVPENVPESPGELFGRLDEIDEDGAVQQLISMASKTLAYGTRGRYDQTKASEVFGSLVCLLGHGTRWWSNTDAGGAWDPVTRHTMDSVVIGVGNDITVTVLVFDED